MIKFNNILTSITSNTDNLSWKELNCLYRPWAIVFKSFNESYYDIYILLVSFIITHTKKTNSQRYKFIEAYKIYLEDFFGVSINEVEFENKYDLIQKVKYTIDNNEPVLISGDLYELSYNPMYKLEHYSHLFIIKGYDIKREIFYILDNIHIDCGVSTIYTDFTIRFDELYELIKSEKEFRKEQQESMHFYSFKNNRKKCLTEIDALLKLKEMLLKIENNEMEEWFWEERLIYNMDNSKVIDNINYTINTKGAYYKTLFKMLNKVGVNNLEELECLYKKSEKKWDSFKMKIFYKMKKCSTEKEDLLKLYLENIKLDKELRQKIIFTISNIKVNNNIKEEEYLIINNKFAEFEEDKENNKIIVHHDEKNVYDTWINKDDAIQFIVNKSKEIATFSICVKNTFKNLDCFLNGIIIKLDSGRKYMFGNHKNESLVIFNPNLGKDFEIYNNYNILLDEIFLKIQIYNNTINFYYKECSQDNYINIHNEPLYENIKHIGFFSKTWEYINGDTTFNSIIYN